MSGLNAPRFTRGARAPRGGTNAATSAVLRVAGGTGAARPEPGDTAPAIHPILQGTGTDTGRLRLLLTIIT